MRERLISGIALLLSIFVFYTSFFGSFETLIQRSLFVIAISALGFLMYPTSKGSFIGTLIDSLAFGIVLASSSYIIVNFTTIMVDLPMATVLDVIMGFGTLLCVLWLSYRVSSIIFPIIVISAVLYTLFGDLLPGRFGHRGFDIYYVTEVLFLGDKGLWGMLVNVASTTLAAFVLFGALLLHTGAGEAFFKLANRIAGRSTGGAAKVATIASAFFATISGSTVANVATTGNFTIPLMKRLNYPPAMAGGIEAIASTGGQLMPPIMGTAAFVMAELLGMNYWLVVVAATLPAIFFYVGILVSIHLAAARLGINETAVEGIDMDLPGVATPLTLKEFSPVIAGFGGIVVGILNGNSIGLTACFGMIGIMIAFLGKGLIDQQPMRTLAKALIDAFIAGGRGVVIVGLLLVAAQVFVSMVNLTGVGVTISSAILDAANGNIMVITAVMAIVCLIAGMGLPTSAAYVLVAAVFAPALISQGLDPLAVHLFVLYFACLSVITPPVCVGAFVAATIADASWLQVAKYAMLIGAGCYCIPFLFFAYPGLLLTGDVFDITNGVLAGLVIAFAVPNLVFGDPRQSTKRLGAWLLSGLAIASLFGTSLIWSALGGLAVLSSLLLTRSDTHMQHNPLQEH
jgi:TRAP transporter 4TM/12TM fusion protein